ncbi:DUF4363 family protein [Clostridium sp.]|uniref:DUF4363 family protein n=1 Tax=Clostridium sp. TaxID=1506 RepID=UPI002FC8147C
MRKFLLVSIPIFSIIIFIAIMLSGNYLKKTTVNDNNFPKLIKVVTEDIQNERWKEAEGHAEELHSIYNKIINRIQFSSERDEINAINVSLARVEGAIISRNKVLAIDGLFEAYEHWNQLGN